MPKKIFIIAGEPSGDLHGSNLIIELLIKSPDLEIIGMGGELMQAAGAQLLYKIGKESVIGFVEVLKNIPHYKKLFRNLLSALDTEKPDLVILIDFPGFNLSFAEDVKKRNIPVIYYVSPQVWAWAKGRIKTIRNVVDKMLVFFEFEKDLYVKHNVDVTFVGHPLVDSVIPSMTKETAVKTFGLDPDKKIVALMPGSRHTEVKKVLPVMLKSAQLIAKNYTDKESVQFILIKSPIINLDVYGRMLGSSHLSVKIINDNRYDAINCCDLALVASGTATLETAMLGVPMVLIYKVAFLTWLIARVLIRIPYIGLVNVVAGSPHGARLSAKPMEAVGKKIIPEFIQFNAIASKIAAESIGLLNNPSKTKLMRSELMKVKESLGPAGASERAADEILAFLDARDTNTGRIS